MSLRLLLMDLPFAAVLIAAAGTDLDRRRIPNRLTLGAATWALAVLAAVLPEQLPEQAAAGASTFAAMLALALVRPAGLGMGDVKLAGVMGLYLGAAVAPAVLFAFVSGAVAGTALAVRRGAPVRTGTVPLAPFLALGGVVGMVGGPALLGLYAELGT